MTTTLETDRAAFLSAIRESPDDDTPRLVYADWLTEQEAAIKCPECHGVGRPFPFQYARELTHKFTCRHCDGTGRVSNGMERRARFIRNGVALAQTGLHDCPFRRLAVRCGVCDFCRCAVPLDQDCAKVWLGGTPVDCAYNCDFNRPQRWHDGDGPPLFLFSRGFAQTLFVSWDDWERGHEQILAHPDVVLQRVELVAGPSDVNDLRKLHNTKAYQQRFGAGYHVQILAAMQELFPGHCPDHPITFTLPGEDT